MPEPLSSGDRLKTIERALRELFEPLFPRLAWQLAEHMRKRGIPKGGAPHRSDFTERELEYMRWACDEANYTRRQIAERMGMSVHGVDKRCHAVYKKLGIQSRLELLAAMRKYKLLDEDIGEKG